MTIPLAKRLRHRVTIQHHVAGVDGAGQPVSDWSDVCRPWAEIQDVSGREFVAATAERAEVTTRIRIRRRSGLTSAMRVLHGSTVYEIKVPLEEGRDVTLLMCKKVVS